MEPEFYMSLIRISVLLGLLVLCINLFIRHGLGKFIGNASSNCNIQVLERTAVAPDVYLAMVRIGSRYYAAGISEKKIEIIREIDEGELLAVSVEADDEESLFENIRKCFHKIR